MTQPPLDPPINASAGAVPLLLGVTGHRQIAPELMEPLQRAVQQVLVDLRRRYSKTPLVLLSPLGAGADQLVADAALAPGAPSDVHLVAVLPWPRELDAEIRTPDGERGRCTRLIEQARQVVTMPVKDNGSVAKLRTDSAARERQYDQAGRYIARHCQILIAVWDGNTASDSHTAKIVRYHSEGAPAPFTARVGALDTPEQAVVCHLSTQTDVSKSAKIAPQWIWPQVTPETIVRKTPQVWWQWIGWTVRMVLVAVHRLLHVTRWRWFRPANAGEELLRQRWRSMDRFNADIRRYESDERFRAALQTNLGYLIPDETVRGLPTSIQSLRTIYGLADTVAGRWQTHTWRAVRGLFVIALLAIASLELYAHRFEHVIWLMFYLGFLGCGYVLFSWTHRVGHQGRWLDSRALAEALRVQIFWRWAGLSDCVADHYLRHFRGELDWIRHASRAVHLMSGGHSSLPASDPADEKSALQNVLKFWITDQHKFFARSTPGNSELEIVYNTAARLAFAGAVVIALCHLWHHADTHHMNHTLALATFGCLVAAAFLEEYGDVRAYALLARRYRWMSALFGAAESRLQLIVNQSPFTAAQAGDAKELLFALGQEALAENADWVIQHRERPPVLPGG